MRIHVPDRISALAPYTPGRAEETVLQKYGLKQVAKLASNENPLGPSPKALEAMREEGPRVHRYPVADGWDLRQALSRKYGVDPDQIVLGNGSTDLIETICLTFLDPADNVVISEGAFIMYWVAIQRTNGNPKMAPMRDMTHDLEAMAGIVDSGTRLMFIANPNNPTGTYNTADEMKRLLATVPEDVLVVVDEAYYEYIDRPDYPDTLAMLESDHPNLVILRTFSKAHGLAGMRIGYGIASKEVTGQIHRVRSPFNTSRIAQAAALAALDDHEHIERSVQLNNLERGRVASALEDKGLRVVPSVANFVLADVKVDGEAFFEEGCKLGVIVRPMRAYGFPTCVRISIGTPEQNDLLLAAVDELRKMLQ